MRAPQARSPSLNDAANAARPASAGADADITGEGSSARVVVLTAREDLEIARQVRGVLGA